MSVLLIKLIGAINTILTIVFNLPYMPVVEAGTEQVPCYVEQVRFCRTERVPFNAARLAAIGFAAQIG